MDDVSTSEENEPAPRRRRGRRPAGEVRAEVLAAAADLLFHDGMAAVTFERVSAASGASKTTLYKWWPSPGALAAEAYFDRVEEALEFPDTGDVETDLRAQLLAFTDLMTHDRAGQVVRELIGAAQGDLTLRAALAASYGRPRRDEAIRVLARARDRGQLRADAPLDVVVDQLWGACYHRLLVLDEPLSPELVDRLVDNALHGAAPAGDAAG
jgi:AcrR family transcriptional regulator